MNPHRGKILVADDDPVIRSILQKIFEKSGFEIIPARNGKEAADLLSNEICAVILDLEMPVMGGIECLRHIKNKFPNLSPIMLTASNEFSSAVEAMRNGAFDYITKPFNPRQLVALVDKAIETDAQAKRLRRVEAELAKAREREIETASKIQQTLLMGVPPKDFKGMEIANWTIPSQKVDGDFYDFIVIDSQCLDVVVGDVMGKGIASALLGAALKSYFLRVIHELECAGTRGDAPPPEPDAIVARVQSAMVHQMEELETFVTLCYARFDLSRKQMRFVDCGHMRTIQYHRVTRTCSLLQGVNMPLGFPETEPFTQIAVPFADGDLFFFYSDGLTEAMNSDGLLFGEERLVASVKTSSAFSPHEIIEKVWIDIVSFSGSDAFRDDFTCVVVKIDLPESAVLQPNAESKMTFRSDLKQLSGIRQFIRNFCKTIPEPLLGEDRISRIELAVTEVATNIIRHAYSGQSDASLQVAVRLFPEMFLIEFLDQGKGFCPESIPQPEFDGSREGGFGLYIVSQIVDDVVYSRGKDNTNCTQLKILLKSAP
jgi:sigma-B regulation protein RsbU (phosphoserine phosphatase)